MQRGAEGGLPFFIPGHKGEPIDLNNSKHLPSELHNNNNNNNKKKLFNFRNQLLFGIRGGSRNTRSKLDLYPNPNGGWT